MKVSLKWLKDYVPVGISADKLSHKLTMAGLEVEKTENVKGDTVFELEITPNRPDCLNMIGIAREVSAILNTKLKVPKIVQRTMPKEKCSIIVLDKKGCQRYIGTVINNVRMADSVKGVNERLETVGLRAINNIVDITNFCLMETGQPLHAFDYDKLEGKKIIVRRALKEEKITTLDGVTRTLDPSILVIADAKRAVAIAGIMGGQDTEVTKNTKNVFLESAYFDPVLIRRAARKLGLSSDSSYRFERGVDVQMVKTASTRATALILENAGGSAEKFNDTFSVKSKVTQTRIKLGTDQINAVLGSSLTSSRCKTILQKLECTVSAGSKGQLTIIPPSFRGDLKQDVDVVEEIARIIGYDNLPASFPMIKAFTLPEDGRRRANNDIRKILLACGLNEIITYSLTNLESLGKTQLQSLPSVHIKNPLTQEQEIMRPHLLPGFLSILQSNFNRRQNNIEMFEIGKVYFSTGEKDVLALAMTGTRSLEDWRILQKERVDFYDIKGVVSQVTARMGVENIHYNVGAKGFFAPGQGATLTLGKDRQEIGLLGKVNSSVLKAWDIRQDNIFFAQIEIEPLLRYKKKRCRYKNVSEYPAMTRDVSLAVKKGVSFGQIKEIASQLGEGLLVKINFIGRYVGEQIDPGDEGLTFSFVYQSLSQTLTEEQINTIHKRICQDFADKLGATLR